MLIDEVLHPSPPGGAVQAGMWGAIVAVVDRVGMKVSTSCGVLDLCHPLETSRVHLGL